MVGKVAYWSLLEPGFGVICCCIPVLQPVASKFGKTSLWSKLTPVFSSSQKNRNSKYNGEEDGKNIRRIDDGLYPLTDISLGQDSEQRGEHATPYAV